MAPRTPWYKHYGEVPRHLDYPDVSMINLIENNSRSSPDLIAYEFMNQKVTYAEFLDQIHQCARALKAIGIRRDDRVTICMPNAPQGIIMFYAVNLMGVISNMVHPLSSEGEIKRYLRFSHSKAILVLDQFYDKVAHVRMECPELTHVIVASVGTELSGITKIAYAVSTIGKYKVDYSPSTLSWVEFMKRGLDYDGPYVENMRGNDPASILYSGGTTGTTKGILLSNLNFNALGMQTGAASRTVAPGQKMLSIMPIFHGFGLGIGIHTMLIHNCCCHLVPRFSVETYAKLLKKVQPNYIAGVPTLYEALLRSDKMKNVDLGCLLGAFSGGDSLSVELKRKVDTFLREHGATIQIREGYGLTECVTASCLTPKDEYRVGSIGIPFPDTYYKIVRTSTKVELPYGEEGEICISGPSVMLKYLDNEEETASTLQRHEDGLVWLHTGDLGVMDEDGFIYFKQRLKRMIISSGYSIYPSQLENIIDAHKYVLMSSVIGVPDPYKIQKVKAYIVLKKGIKPTPEVRASIEEYCRKNIAHYALPYEYEYRDDLPKTLVGKVAFTVLEKEALEEIEGDPLKEEKAAQQEERRRERETKQEQQKQEREAKLEQQKLDREVRRDLQKEEREKREAERAARLEQLKREKEARREQDRAKREKRELELRQEREARRMEKTGSQPTASGGAAFVRDSQAESAVQTEEISSLLKTEDEEGKR